MLYDNAQLISLYAEAFSITHDPIFKESVIDTIDWLKREMHHPSGGFYSALDADSEGVEGKFYTWTAEELQAILGDDTENLMQHFQATAEGNWEHRRNICEETRKLLLPKQMKLKI
jgi:uncharacterized protein YyaL (SSP411 family)